MKQANIIAPSILSADFARLGEECEEVIRAGADWIHFDVMDNHYVPNLTIGPVVLKALRNYGIKVPIDVHLMVEPVDTLIKSFAESGASYITFHYEASKHPDRSLQLIRDLGCKAGIVLNISTASNVLDFLLSKLDIILLMGVNPGFEGQKFEPAVISKIKKIRALIDQKGLPIKLEIDGGINLKNIRQIAQAGIDTFVAGSTIFYSKNYQEIIQQLQEQISIL